MIDSVKVIGKAKCYGFDAHYNEQTTYWDREVITFSNDNDDIIIDTSDFTIKMDKVELKKVLNFLKDI